MSHHWHASLDFLFLKQTQRQPITLRWTLQMNSSDELFCPVSFLVSVFFLPVCPNELSFKWTLVQMNSRSSHHWHASLDFLFLKQTQRQPITLRWTLQMNSSNSNSPNSNSSNSNSNRGQGFHNRIWGPNSPPHRATAYTPGSYHVHPSINIVELFK